MGNTDGIFTVMEHRPVIKRGWEIPEVNGGTAQFVIAMFDYRRVVCYKVGMRPGMNQLTT